MRDNELFSNGVMYHVYNRGVDKRDTFTDDRERTRFVKSIVAFNDVGRKATRSLSAIDDPPISDNPYVHVVAYSLMPNHYHLLLVQIASGGISEFMRRLGTGYTQFFNKRHERSGSLFETAYKIKRVTTTTYARHLSRYIHLNPLELIGLNWKAGKINWAKANSFLRNYRWSSFRHYVGLDDQAFVHKDRALKDVGDTSDYLRFLSSWVERDWKKIAAFELF